MPLDILYNLLLSFFYGICDPFKYTCGCTLYFVIHKLSLFHLLLHYKRQLQFSNSGELPVT